MVPGIQAVALGQFAQMLRHFKERSVALLACRHGHDLPSVFPRPRHGDQPELLEGSGPTARPAKRCQTDVPGLIGCTACRVRRETSCCPLSANTHGP